MSRSLLQWSRIWKHTPDPDYAVDLNVHAALRRLDAIDDGCIGALSSISGHSIGECKKSFNRLFWSGVIKRKLFNPPDPSTYTLTKRKVRRTPLGGKRFRETTPPWDGRWRENRSTVSISKRERGAYLEALVGQACAIHGYDLRGRQKIIVPMDEGNFDLQRFVERLNPKVAEFVLTLSDGGTIDEARKASKLTEEQVGLVLPKLRTALAELTA